MTEEKKTQLRELASSLPLEDWEVLLRKLIYNENAWDKTTAIQNVEFIISFLKNEEA